jgi:hypothetical protein
LNPPPSVVGLLDACLRALSSEPRRHLVPAVLPSGMYLLFGGVVFPLLFVASLVYHFVVVPSIIQDELAYSLGLFGFFGLTIALWTLIGTVCSVGLTQAYWALLTDGPTPGFFAALVNPRGAVARLVLFCLVYNVISVMAAILVTVGGLWVLELVPEGSARTAVGNAGILLLSVGWMLSAAVQTAVLSFANTLCSIEDMDVRLALERSGRYFLAYPAWSLMVGGIVLVSSQFLLATYVGAPLGWFVAVHVYVRAYQTCFTTSPSAFDGARTITV